jgi:hypothetical protein
MAGMGERETTGGKNYHTQYSFVNRRGAVLQVDAMTSDGKVIYPATAEWQRRVSEALDARGYGSKKWLAEELGIGQSHVSKLLGPEYTGKPSKYVLPISELLGTELPAETMEVTDAEVWMTFRMYYPDNYGAVLEALRRLNDIARQQREAQEFLGTTLGNLARGTTERPDKLK